ncbi:hypothetical protein [Haliangium ochraceum]|uniref:Lipoprotein n=1 Tax=Haliangium ochraceum (strain DSM 14365 / JCM 11303 / SMP-2) TaxID=502025 RepID=D0LLZ7_HALO1|nr:hypothetical protein [Haliangium ochraceum]ACY15175.1 hypothetical protein Hoch_2643 [Haliangium ochraceum DSM 14365]
MKLSTSLVTLLSGAALAGCALPAADLGAVDSVGSELDDSRSSEAALDEQRLAEAESLAELERQPADGPSVQSMMGVDGILDMCLNLADPWNEFHECIFDLDTQSITYCSPDLAGSVQMAAQQPGQGLVVEVDLDGWDAMLVAAVADSVSDYAFHIGNDRNNNGWAGGSSAYDSEAHLFGNGLHVYRNDIGGSTRAAALGNAIPNPGGGFCSTENGAFCATVKDGYFKWLREDPTSASGVSAMEVTDPHIFRVDTAAGANDSTVYVGFEHVVQALSGRSGGDLQSEVRIVMLR